VMEQLWFQKFNFRGTSCFIGRSSGMCVHDAGAFFE
jgi:hypothetical protein